MSSEKEGGGGARVVRWEGSAAGTKGEGNDVRRDCGVLVDGEMDAAEDGRDGNSCDSLLELPDVFLRTSGGRVWDVGVPRAGDPARSAEGTDCSEGLLIVAGEPIWRGDGTPSMAGRLPSCFWMRRSFYKSTEGVS